MDCAAQAQAAQLPPALVSGIKEALACGLIGVVVSAVVYGITVLQAYIYFRDKGQDSKRLRYFVALLFFLDTISMALTVSIYYEYFVTAFGNQSLLLSTPTTFAFENGVTVIIGTLTQWYALRVGLNQPGAFLTPRTASLRTDSGCVVFAVIQQCPPSIQIVSKRNVMVVGTIIVLALCSCGPGIAISINLHTHSDIYYLGSLETRILAGFANGLSVICDIVIAAALTYYLHYKRTGFKKTDSMIDRLIIYAINRGALTAMCQAGHMITIVGFPGHFIFFVFGLLDGKLYCNTLLATLNAQKSMSREENTVMELGTQLEAFKRGRSRGEASQQSDREPDRVPPFVVDVTHEKTVAYC
ncbi:hypothetical protein GSI_02729 [Ganoderma sinense ZZ0214-1]|uniref:DUF6534 domain-containing protein n=1 Tax=Ganoderma sinense ZZ0214-1 TaxID=1077348 RepID=A0A2G8SMF1_9APHY|nr:hypothetical protein GSI_02729 [Ganoderma sinense ZZ0214-1]